MTALAASTLWVAAWLNILSESTGGGVTELRCSHRQAGKASSRSTPATRFPAGSSLRPGTEWLWSELPYPELPKSPAAGGSR